VTSGVPTLNLVFEVNVTTSSFAAVGREVSVSESNAATAARLATASDTPARGFVSQVTRRTHLVHTLFTIVAAAT